MSDEELLRQVAKLEAENARLDAELRRRTASSIQVDQTARDGARVGEQTGIKIERLVIERLAAKFFPGEAPVDGTRLTERIGTLAFP